MARVAVIGAGLAGCSVAWHLASTHDVTLLERNPLVGAEASAQNAGMIRLLGEDPAERALALRTERWLECPGEDFDARLLSRRTGAVLALTRDPLYLNDAVAHVRAHEVEVQEVDAAELREIAPVLTNSPLRRAWWLPSARVADPHQLLRGFERGLLRRGGRLELDAQVERLELHGSQVRGVRVGGSVLESDAVVLAAGAWSGTLAQQAGLTRPLFPLRRTLMMSAPDAAVPPEHPWCWIDDEGLYVRPESGGWLMSACDERLDWPRRSGDSRGPVQPEVRALLHDKIKRLLPSLSTVQSGHGWSGLRTFAADRAPMLGPDPDLKGLWWATGLGGYGVSCCKGVGEAIAQWLNDSPPDWLHTPSVAPERHHLTRFPIRPSGEVFAPRLLNAATASSKRP